MKIDIDLKQLIENETGEKFNNSYKIKCPFHNEKTASLSIKKDNSYWKCFGCGCGGDAIDFIKEYRNMNYIDACNYLGIELDPINKEIYTNFEKVENIAKKTKDLTFIKLYSFTGADNKILYYKAKFKDNEGNKQCRYYHIENGNVMFNRGHKEIPYNYNRLIKGIENNKYIFITEGEKDADTLSFYGYIATSFKGVKEFDYSIFKGRNVVIMADNDEPGQKYAKDIQSSLKNYAHATKIITISNKPKGDITDWITEGHDIQELKEILDNEPWNYAPWIYEKNKKGNLGVNQGIIAKHLKNNLSYKLIGKPGSNKTMIFMYSDGIYKEISRKSLNKYIEEYIPESLVASNLTNNISDLLTNEDTYPYSILNGSDNIINLQNGLYDVTTGELKPHSSNYISSIQLNVKYNPNYINHGYWDNFLDTLTMGDNELKNIIQEWYGLILSNYDASICKKVLVLYGVGDTGKSKPINVLEKLLGEGNSTSVTIQKLGDRFALGDIYKSRLIHYGDLPSDPINDSSLTLLKCLTGGDTVSVEKKGIDPFNVKYRGGIMYSCNDLPKLRGDLGKHVFNRFIIIPCNKNSIPEKEQNSRLLEELLLDKEYIFNWSMEGLKRLISNNFKFSHSQKSEDAKFSYSIKSDSVRAFIDERYDITGDKKDKVKPKLYDEYILYCNIEGRKPISKPNFKDRMANIGVKYGKSSTYYYFGLKPKELIPVNEENTPFDAEIKEENNQQQLNIETIQPNKKISWNINA